MAVSSVASGPAGGSGGPRRGGSSPGQEGEAGRGVIVRIGSTVPVSVSAGSPWRARACPVASVRPAAAAGRRASATARPKPGIAGWQWEDWTQWDSAGLHGT